jgi:hypothetical protein
MRPEERPFRVTVYASSSERIHADYFAPAERLGFLIADHGFELVWGGGRFGLMGAVSRGARARGGAMRGDVMGRFHNALYLGDVNERIKILREQKVPGDPHEAIALKNGNWLVTCGDGHQVVEVNPAGETVWSLGENDLPGHPLRLMAGAQRLPNGNTILCNYLGHGHIGENPQIYEVTPDKQLVWSFADHAQFKTINQIQILDTPVDVLKEEIYR